MTIINKTSKLLGILSMSSLDGTMTLLSGSGLLSLKGALLVAFPVIAGPTAILIALSLGGTMKERMIASLVAGLLATLLVVVAATLGTKLTEFLNFKLLRIFGASVVLMFALMLFGFNIPDKIPLSLMGLGVVSSFFIR
jgi:uncharacterized membrane protein (UPF0136 family)